MTKSTPPSNADTLSAKLGKRKKPRATCPRCIIGGYRLLPEGSVTGKPQFQCTRCGNTWTCGNNGGRFMEALR